MKQHLLYLLVSLLVEDKQYSIEELKKQIDVKKDKDLLRNLCGILSVGLNSIENKTYIGEYEYLLNCCNYIFNIIRRGQKLNIEAIDSSIRDCQKILKSKVKLFSKDDILWRDYFNRLKDKLNMIHIALSYLENQSIIGDEYEFVRHIIFEEKRYNIVKNLLQLYPSFVKLVDENKKTLFFNIVDHYIKLIKEGTNEEECQYFEKIIQLIWYSSTLLYKEEERAHNLEEIEVIMNRYRILLSKNKKDENERNNIITKLQFLKDILNDTGKLLDSKRFVLAATSYNVLEHIKFSDGIKIEIADIIRSRETDEYFYKMDFFKNTVITIDRAGTEAIDDGLSLEKVNNNYVLGIHIADVSHYVQENSLIDKEALARASSIYLPKGVIPMIPSELGTNLCSLKPNAIKRVITLLVLIDNKGNVIGYDFQKNIIKPQHRMKYEDVCRTIRDGNANPRLRNMLRDLLKLSHILQSRKNNEIINEDDISDTMRHELTKTGYEEKVVGSEMVATYMVLANQLFAEEFVKRKLPCIFLVSAGPNKTAIGKRKQYLNSMLEHGKITSAEYNQLLSAIAETPESEYSVRNVGHHELRCEAYTNWTSPIRRYIDLYLQYLLEDNIFNPITNNREAREEKMEMIAKHMNRREREIKELIEEKPYIYIKEKMISN